MADKLPLLRKIAALISSPNLQLDLSTTLGKIHRETDFHPFFKLSVDPDLKDATSNKPSVSHNKILILCLKSVNARTVSNKFGEVDP